MPAKPQNHVVFEIVGHIASHLLSVTSDVDVDRAFFSNKLGCLTAVGQTQGKRCNGGSSKMIFARSEMNA